LAQQLFKPVDSIAYECLVWSFYKNLKYDCSQPNVLVSFIDDKDVEVTKADITAVLKCPHKPPEVNEPWIDCPSILTLEDIVSDMCEGQYADRHKNAASKAKIPPQLWFVDVVLQKNVCPLGHKTQRWDMFLSTLYLFHRGFWCSIPEIIWRQLYKFWEGVHHRVAEPTRSWGLPFLFLITHILQKKGIKGNVADGPITENPRFGQIQWNQSCSYMPRVTTTPERKPELAPEPMDIHETATKPEIAAALEMAGRELSNKKKIEINLGYCVQWVV
jgi:hypothetical protein